MPNHVTNDIIIVGTDEEVQAVRDFVRTKENPFDFNVIAKIPDILVGTRSPSKIISQEEYDRQELIIKTFERHKDLKDLDLIVAMNKDLGIPLTTEEKNSVKFYNFHGYSRGITKKLQQQALYECGTDNWYDWQCNAWGTKWNSYSHYGIGEDTDSGNAFGFQTAWSHPFPIIEGLSKKFPTLQFDIRFADEDTGSNVGEYSILNGEIIADNFPDSGSDEAYELALDINGSEYELYDIFNDYSEEDFDTYLEICLRLAIKQETLDEDIPLFVLQKALDQCIETENFEYADKLKGFITLAEK